MQEEPLELLGHNKPQGRLWENRRMRALLLAVLALAVAGTVAGVAVGATSRSATPESASAIHVELPCCIPLGRSMQLRYANVSAQPGAEHLEFALIGAIGEHAWMSFGPADPRARSRYMVSLSATHV